MINDAKIVADIRNGLASTMEISSHDINIESLNGNVLLYGVVDVLSEKDFAEKIAKKVTGVNSIENKLTISMDSNMTDSYIKEEIENKIHANDYSERLLQVGVDMKSGTAVLVGHVDTLFDENKALKLARTARGVREVVSNIKISSAGKLSDESITNNVVDLLQSNNLYPPGTRVDTREGKVFLNGHLESFQQVEMAGELAMSVEGVIDIVNKLERKA